MANNINCILILYNIIYNRYKFIFRMVFESFSLLGRFFMLLSSLLIYLFFYFFTSWLYVAFGTSIRLPRDSNRSRWWVISERVKAGELTGHDNQQKPATPDRSAVGVIGRITDFGSAGDGSIPGDGKKQDLTESREKVIEAERKEARKDVRKVWIRNSNNWREINDVELEERKGRKLHRNKEVNRNSKQHSAIVYHKPYVMGGRKN